MAAATMIRNRLTSNKMMNMMKQAGAIGQTVRIRARRTEHGSATGVLPQDPQYLV